jgi:polo-like kinase 1
MSSQTGRKEDIPIPDIVIDPSSGNRYLKGKFLGKGGFARCYELTEMNSKEIFAGKIVSKQLLTKPHQKEKMTQEIAIHRAVHQQHIVEFYSFFEDDQNVYIILELCRRRSLMEMHKRRKAITEPETRYFMRQIVLACQYLHDNKIIHRDLKLGNLFLNDDMELKIGDFGLATRVDFEGERKKTLCGTPNYIAPEVLNKKGHSYEVDVWSLGCILYTLLIGKPPFETSCLKDTYAKIKKNEFTIPPNKISSQAKNLIHALLQPDPNSRPTMQEILNDDFFHCGYCPPRLPTTCLSMPPRFDRDLPASMHQSMNHNGQMMNGMNCANGAGSNGQSSNVAASLRKPLLEINDGKSTLQIGPGGANDPLRNLMGGDGRSTSAASTAQLQQ